MKQTKTNNILKTIKISNISKESSGILVGKKQNNVYLTDASKVLIVDKANAYAIERAKALNIPLTIEQLYEMDF